MYIYCIFPCGKLKSNFIKIGSCTKIESLKRRYSTYYGSTHKSYYIKVNRLSLGTIIHKKLKDMNLHMENELFMYNELYDLNFYIQQINKIYFETIIDGNYCIHKYKRGKLEGSFCGKKVENNNDKMYLCLQHDKKYISRKKVEIKSTYTNESDKITTSHENIIVNEILKLSISGSKSL